MSLSSPFIRRPVATTLLMIAMLLSGLLAWRLLPVAALPQVDYPIIQVFTYYPGAGPDVTTSAITAPLERRLGQIPGLQQMASASGSGASVITLRFALDLDMSIAEQEVQAALSAAGNLLPNDLPAPPIYRKVNPADTPILTLAITSPTMPLPDLYDLVDTRMAQQLAQVNGVGMISLAGGQRPAIRIQVNPAALASYGLDMEAVRSAIAAANANQPKGRFDGPRRTIMMSANDQMRSPEDYRALILTWREGAPLRLGDIAEVVSGPEDSRLAAWSGELPAVLLNIQRQPGANVIEVVDRIQTLLPQLTDSLPASVDVAVLTDRTQNIRASVTHVLQELLLAIVLVVLVTLVFLRNAAATLIPSLAVPLSLIGTFGVIYLAGFSINTLTLMALTIATGFVVDDAIVMLENIARHRERGEPPLQAALKGASQIGFTLVSLTFSLIAVLIPLLFMQGVVGRLFHEFAITLAIAILISLVVSLTLTPMMCARMLPAMPPGHSERRDWLSGVIERYDAALGWVLRHQTLALSFTLATVAATALLYAWMPKGFFPVQDGGTVLAVTEAPQTVSFASMAQRQQALAQALLQDPDVASLSSFIGVDGTNNTLNSGRIQINLKPYAEREGGLQQTLARLAEQAAGVEGIQAWFQPVQELTIDDRISRTQYQLTLTSPSLDDLEEWAPRLVDRLRELPDLTDVSSDLQNDGLQAYIDVDRDAAARLGISMAAIDAALYDAYAQRQVSTLFTQANQYRIVLEVSPEFASEPADLGRLYIASGNGTPVPLSSIARISERRAPVLISHVGQFPATTISFNLAPGASLGSAVSAIEAAEQEIGLPASVAARFAGAAEAFSESLSNTLWLILAAIVTMYIVLGILYESAIHPITILSTLPSAAVGALLALLLTGGDLDLIAVIGIILLIGLVKKNGIMMIDFALDAERNAGMAPEDAIRRAALQRFRPILMTTLAALFGAIPLMFATGAGAELRQPLGVVMVGGLLVSQILTIFTTPVIYLFFDRLFKREGRTHAADDMARPKPPPGNHHHGSPRATDAPTAAGHRGNDDPNGPGNTPPGGRQT